MIIADPKEMVLLQDDVFDIEYKIYK